MQINNQVFSSSKPVIVIKLFYLWTMSENSQYHVDDMMTLFGQKYVDKVFFQDPVFL